MDDIKTLCVNYLTLALKTPKKIPLFNDYVDSYIQQPKIFDIEIAMKEKHFRTVKDVNGIPYDHEYTLEPKITNNSIKITKIL